MNSIPSLESSDGPTCSIKEVAEYLNVKEYTIWAMTYVPGRKDLKNSKIQKNVEKYTEGKNLKGRYGFGGEIRVLKESVQKYVSYRINRDPGKDRVIINNARKSLLILGINGLGPLHQNRELIIKLLDSGGKVRVLLLDPRSDSFEERVDFEKCCPNQDTNRLLFEFLASYAICKELVECSKVDSDFVLKLYSSQPTMSLVICDYEDDSGVLNQNIYPRVQGSRGMTGDVMQVIKMESRAHFEGLVGQYFELFDGAVQIDLNENPDKYLKTIRFTER